MYREIREMTQPELLDVSSKYGAPMGRESTHDESSKSVPVVFTVALLKMVDGDYDEGGVYWGGGKPAMYRATSEGNESEIDLFFRAASVDAAKDLVKADYPLAAFSDDTLDEFTEAYIAAALWSTRDDEDNPLDDEHSSSDIAPEALTKIIADCLLFQHENAKWLTDEFLLSSSCGISQQAGHDFWLTRAGHGCGFWDGDWEDNAGEALTRSSKSFGEVDFYAGDDGKIYS
jgi:hypothetical protein